MRALLNLFRPPEWSWWPSSEKIAYVVSLTFFLGLMALGGVKAREILLSWLGGYS